MSARRDHDQLVMDERQALKVGILQRRPDDREVEVVAEHRFLDLTAVSDLERDGEARVILLEGAQRGRNDVDADRHTGADLERPAFYAAQSFQRDRRLIEQDQRPPHVLVEELAGLRQLYALAEPVEEREAERR